MRKFNLNGHLWLALAAGIGVLQGTSSQRRGKKVQMTAAYPLDGAVPFVMGTAQEAGRAIGIVATAAGNIKVTFADASEVTIPVAVGLTTFPWSVTTLTLAGVASPATATGFNQR